MSSLYIEIKRVFVHVRFPLQAYTLLGFLFALNIVKIEISYIVLLALLSWFFLTAGVTVFNSYYDKDETSVAGLKNPPKVTSSLFFGSVIFKLLGFVIAFFINSIFISFYILIVILSILYSHRWFRLKSNGFVAVFFNFIMGAITFFATASLGEIVLLPTILGAATSGLFMVTVYLLMQVHQTKDDTKRGDFSIATLYGKRVTLVTANVFLSLAVLIGAFALYFSSLIIHMLVLAVYVIVGFIFINLWLKNKEKPDYDIMSKITNYLAYTGDVLLLALYLVI